MGEMYVSPPVYKIPNEYQGVEYLQTDGTAYISTDFYPTNNSKVVIKASNFKIANEDESDLKLLGCRSTSSVDAFTLWILAAKINSESKLQPCLLRGQFSDTINEYIQLGDEESGYEYPQLTDWDENTIFTLTLDSSGLIIQYTNTNNEEINVTYALQATPTDFTSLYNLVLFGTNTADEISTASHSFKIHECLLYEENKLVEWYIPVYKKNDNTFGIYNVIKRKFYINSNENGNFSIGSNINKEYINEEYTYYQKLEYINAINNEEHYLIPPQTYLGGSNEINYELEINGKIIVPNNNLLEEEYLTYKLVNGVYERTIKIKYINNKILFYHIVTNKIEDELCEIEANNINFNIKINLSSFYIKINDNILFNENKNDTIGYSTWACEMPFINYTLNNSNIYINSFSITQLNNLYKQEYEFYLKFPDKVITAYKLKSYSLEGLYRYKETNEKIFFATKVSKAYIPHGIPPEYQQLEWIQASSDLILDSGYIPNYKTEIYGKFSNVSSYGSITGVEIKENSTSGFWLTYTESSNFNGRYANTWNDSDEFSISTDDIIEIILNRHSWEIKQNGTSIYSIQKTRSVFNLSENLFILSVNAIEDSEQSYWSHGGNFKIYSFQVREDDRLLRDYYPVKRKSDGVYGLYDVIQQQFYLPTTGSFSCDDEVIIHNTLKAKQVHKVYGSVNNVAKLIKTYPYLPKEYQQVEYIDTAGNTVLDLGFIANENTGFDIDFIQYKNVTTSGYGTIFGARQSTSARRYILSSYNGGIWDYGSATRLQKQGMAKNSRQFYSYRYNAFLRPNNTIATVSSMAAFTTPGNLTLFSLHNTSSTSQIQNGDVRIYSLKFYNRYNKVNDYYPCYRLSDGVVGLYDIVSKQFLTKNAGAALTKGENIIKKL